MDILDVTPIITYEVGGSSTTNFPVPFVFFEDSDLIVTVDGETVAADDYTVTGAGSEDGGEVVLDTGVTNATVKIVRNVPIARTTDFPTSGPLNTVALNNELSRLIAIIQQIVAVDPDPGETPDDTDAQLVAIANLVPQADRGMYWTGLTTAALYTLTSFGRSIAALANAAAGRTLFGLGTAAVEAVGTSGDALGKLNANLTLSGTNTHSGANTFSHASGALARNTAKAFGLFEVTVTTVSFTAASWFNLASVTRTAEGIFDVVFTTALPTVNYVVLSVGRQQGGNDMVYGLATTKLTSGFTIEVRGSAGAVKDPDVLEFTVYGS